MNVKPGDLAIIVITGPHGAPENIGRIVEVVAVAVHGERFVSVKGETTPVDAPSGKPMWRVRSVGSPLAWNSSFLNPVRRYYYERPILDSWLRPVSGLPESEEIPTTANTGI